MRMHNPPHPGEVLRDYLGGVSARCGEMSVVYKAKDLKLGRHVLNAGLRLPGAA
jgi:hypothetical protein